VIGLCLLAGAVARSAQIPMYVWLPDATVGPTPASALLHSATMVTAGIYLLTRLSFLFAAAPAVMAGIIWVGGSTALLAAGLACVQTDIKKVLAYASMSQLGIMFMAVGAGAFGLAIFHLLSHAFFIAILFMGAGVIIGVLDGERDLLAMGGLRSRLKRTWWVMLVGCATLAGLPPLSGFFSRNEILARVRAAEELPGPDALYWVGLVTVGLTAFAISRLFMLIFHGKSKLPRRRRVAIQDPGDLMMWPLYVLAALAVLGGLLGVPQFWGDRMGIQESDSLGNFLAGVLTSAPAGSADVFSLIGSSLASTGLGFGTAYLVYVVRPALPDKLTQFVSLLYRPLTRKHWIDEIYDLLLVRSLLRFSERVVFRRIEVGLIDGVLVGGAAASVRALASHGMKYFQSGLTQGYLLVMVAGALGMLVYLAG
jgi:NADH-quinone oxidoreductase subunit L